MKWGGKTLYFDQLTVAGGHAYLYLLEKVTVVPLDRPTTFESRWIYAFTAPQAVPPRTTADAEFDRAQEVERFKDRRDSEVKGFWK